MEGYRNYFIIVGINYYDLEVEVGREVFIEKMKERRRGDKMREKISGRR